MSQHLGREALVALGEHPSAARRRARLFQAHDEQVLADGYAIRDSDESLVKLAKQSRDQLEKLIAVDKGEEVAERDKAWGD